MGISKGSQAAERKRKVGRLNIRATVPSLVAWRLAAKKRKMDLTAWICEQLDAAAIPVEKQEVGVSVDGKSEPELVKLAKAVKASVAEKKQEVALEPDLPDLNARCKHHKGHGELCYKCDPKMGYPDIR